MGKSKIPDGWLNYIPMKDAFLDARIIPIKVPLPSPQLQWTPADVMQRIPNLGLIIDTTFKSPGYYNSSEFKGIEYAKIMCPGHNLPGEELYQKFSGTVKSFLSNPVNDGKIVALHCTHGINRTGYFLCRYLIENLSYTPDAALAAFALKRGHPMERENYKQALHNLPAVQRF